MSHLFSHIQFDWSQIQEILYVDFGPSGNFIILAQISSVVALLHEIDFCWSQKEQQELKQYVLVEMGWLNAFFSGPFSIISFAAVTNSFISVNLASYPIVRCSPFSYFSRN